MSSETRRVSNKRLFDPAELVIGGDRPTDGGDLGWKIPFHECVLGSCFESFSPSGCKTSAWDLLNFDHSWLILTQPICNSLLCCSMCQAVSFPAQLQAALLTCCWAISRSEIRIFMNGVTVERCEWFWSHNATKVASNQIWTAMHMLCLLHSITSSSCSCIRHLLSCVVFWPLTCCLPRISQIAADLMPWW